MPTGRRPPSTRNTGSVMLGAVSLPEAGVDNAAQPWPAQDHSKVRPAMPSDGVSGSNDLEASSTKPHLIAALLGPSTTATVSGYAPTCTVNVTPGRSSGSASASKVALKRNLCSESGRKDSAGSRRAFGSRDSSVRPLSLRSIHSVHNSAKMPPTGFTCRWYSHTVMMGLHAGACSSVVTSSSTACPGCSTATLREPRAFTMGSRSRA
mmetsp:Transcript_8965/g.22565  ORF Transcript_8965/g.22565 Transcript_8965/m.22565 type:complete len:208 (-) Transcript_8965:3695-4318(-)